MSSVMLTWIRCWTKSQNAVDRRPHDTHAKSLSYGLFLFYHDRYVMKMETGVLDVAIT